MKQIILIVTIIPIMFMFGCNQAEQVKVTYMSDPPGGILYKQNDEPWGLCPKVIWYDIDKDAIRNGYLDVKGLIVRWPGGQERRSSGHIRITVDGTDRKVIFTKPGTAMTVARAKRLLSRR